MKSSIFKSIFFFITAAFTITGCNVTSHTAQMTGINFNNYKTFAWANMGRNEKSDRSNNEIIDNNIKNAVTAELTGKGWVETQADPDVLIDYTIAVKHGHRVEDAPVYSYPFSRYVYRRGRIYSLWFPSSLVGIRSKDVPFREGELTVNMIDTKTNKLIWQGWASGDLNDRQFTSKDVDKQVKSIFKKFKYPGSK